MPTAHTFRFFQFFLLATILWTSPVHAFSGEGSGSEADPFQISSCEELQEIEDNITAHYLIVNDIDCSATIDWNGGLGFMPIGGPGDRFSGSLDGGGHQIVSLLINRPEMDYVGLFSFSSEATIKNLKLIDVDITGKTYVAAVVAWGGDTEISDIFISGVVKGEDHAAALLGFGAGSTIARVGASVNIHNDLILAGTFTGGLIARARDLHQISDCFSTGAVSAGGASYAGGLIGSFTTLDNNGVISRCYASGSAITTGPYAAGLIAFFRGTEEDLDPGFEQIETTVTIEDSYATGAVSSSTHSGGLIGLAGVESFVLNSYYDVDRTGVPNCIKINHGEAGGSCTGVNTDGDQPAYFFKNSSNEPFSTWDFASVWQICEEGNPMFRGLCESELGSVEIQPEVPYREATGSLNISLTTRNAFSENSIIRVIFPAEIELDFGGTTDITGATNMSGDLAVSRSGQVVTVSRGDGAEIPSGTLISFSLTNIRNSSQTGQTGTFTIELGDSENVIVEKAENISGFEIVACPEGFIIPQCDQCQSGYFGSECQFTCPGGANNPCGEHGVCDDGNDGSGECLCDHQYAGVSCSECAPGYLAPDCSELLTPTLSRSRARGQGVRRINCDTGLDDVTLDSYHFRLIRIRNRPNGTRRRVVRDRVMPATRNWMRVSRGRGAAIRARCSFVMDNQESAQSRAITVWRGRPR